jgi:protease secretion system membrane fusion protein
MKLIQQKDAHKDAAADVISHDVAPLTVNTDARAYARLGWLIVLLGVVGFLVWAAFAPLDKGVPMQGTVAKESNRKAVQHQTGGTIQEILVKDGDVVKAGQVLVRMNAINAKAGFEMTDAQGVAAQRAGRRGREHRRPEDPGPGPAGIARKQEGPGRLPEGTARRHARPVQGRLCGP